ncbi:melatonin receptor type 1B-B-like [Ptychodera flava]|uniref:melatonin receptor type 1B-B-like n=1 Tax=Ptychodera flava TaxID=63121 RepID=UPI003969E780
MALEFVTENVSTFNHSCTHQLEDFPKQCQEAVVDEDAREKVSHAVLIYIASFTGSTGNLIVVTAMVVSLVRKRLLPLPINIFVTTLCFADLITSASFLPTLASSVALNYWPGGFHACTFMKSIAVTIQFAVVLILAVVAVCNYCLICQKRETFDLLFSKRNCFAIILTVLCLSVLLAMPVFVSGKQEAYHVIVGECWFHMTNVSHHVHLYIYLRCIGLIYAVPLSTIIIAYSLIFRTVKKARRKINVWAEPSNLKDEQRQSEKAKEAAARRENINLAFNMFVIFLAYIMCWTPITVLTVFSKHCTTFPPILFRAAHVLMHSHPSITPIIYAWRNRNIRQMVVTTFHLHKCGCLMCTANVLPCS